MSMGDHVDGIVLMYGFLGLSGQFKPNLHKGETTNPATWQGLELRFGTRITPV
ncbi:hypothetical protein B878_17886 [Vibrio campbellii CAIM 519 = NBRC 15631 = ATCC 25920]|nr:hypothetical protein B878_17886 [Vibrio campbellii CAIM 519 = NBRC 15631 = ATCC 25920]